MHAFKRQSTRLEDIRPVKVNQKKELKENLIHEFQQIGINEEVVNYLGDMLEVLAAEGKEAMSDKDMKNMAK